MAAFTGYMKDDTKVIFKHMKYNKNMGKTCTYYNEGIIKERIKGTKSHVYFIQIEKRRYGPINSENIQLPESGLIRRSKDYFIMSKKNLFVLSKKTESKNQVGVNYGTSLFHCPDFLPSYEKMITIFSYDVDVDVDLEVRNKYFNCIYANKIDE